MLRIGAQRDELRWSTTAAVQRRPRTSRAPTLELVERCAPGTYRLAEGRVQQLARLRGADVRGGGETERARVVPISYSELQPPAPTGLLDPADRRAAAAAARGEAASLTLPGQRGGT